MSTTRTPRSSSTGTSTRTSGIAPRTTSGGELPPLSTADRLALRLGLALILWGQRHAERTARADRARRSGAAEAAAAHRDRAFEHRSHAGPTW